MVSEKIEQRIIDVEVKISFLDRQLGELGDLVRELGGEMRSLRLRVDALAGGVGGVTGGDAEAVEGVDPDAE